MMLVLISYSGELKCAPGKRALNHKDKHLRVTFIETQTDGNVFFFIHISKTSFAH